MTVTRFFPWPSVAEWLEWRALAQYDYSLDLGWSESGMLLRELCLNSYAVRRVR